MRSLISAVLLCLWFPVEWAPAQTERRAIPAASASNDACDTTGVNSVRMWFSNNGSMSHDPYTDASGMEWPRGSAKHVMFSEGLLFGGLVDGNVHVGGSTYRYGLQAGPILPSGTAADPSDPAHRIYCARVLDAASFARLPGERQRRLREDFMSWPAALGAPWTDRNNNGLYDPDFDVWLADSSDSDSPLFPGEEVFWFVMNDVNPSRAINLYGTPPVGLEIQTLIWSSTGTPALENAIFVKHTIINKSGKDFGSVYLAKWQDPDLGEAIDDFAGCDTVRDMMYVYNGRRADAVYADAPAIGTVLLQGPVLPSPGSVATWNFRPLHDGRNLPMTAFGYIVGGDAQYRDPMLGVAAGSIQVYNFMRGLLYDGMRPRDPVDDRETALCLAGDPVSGVGWIDGLLHRMGDRRIIMSSGPFDMAPGDTQEVVYGTVIAQGSSTMDDIVRLRRSADEIRGHYALLRHGRVIPTLRADVTYPDSSQVFVRVEGAIPHADTADALFFSAGTGVPEKRFVLYDDGAHGDGAAADGIFAGEAVWPRQSYGLNCRVEAVYSDSVLMQWPVRDCLPLSGLVRISGVPVRSDHRNFDGRANPGENVRIGVIIRNQTPFPLGGITISDDGFLPGTDSSMKISTVLKSGGVAEVDYTATNPSSYASIDIPPTAQVGERIPLPFVIRSQNECWCDTAHVTVEDYVEQPVDSLAFHTAGHAFGTLGWRLTDRNALLDHTYRVTIHEHDPLLVKRSVSIFDITAWKHVLVDAPLPDVYAHETPSTDGWKLTAGTSTASTLVQIDDTTFDVGISEYFAPENGWLVANFGPGTGTAWGWGSSVTWADQIPVRIVFDPARTQKAYMYLRGGIPNYGFQNYSTVPFTAWDMSDTLHPRQLNAAFVEQKGSPRQNATWDPRLVSDREYIFVFSSTYSDEQQQPYTSRPIYQANGTSMFDIQYAAWWYIDSTAGPLPGGLTYDITPLIPVSRRDTFYINPRGPAITGLDAVNERAFHIGSIHPNPVMAGSAARITLRAGASGHYTLRLVDVLGRTIHWRSEHDLSHGAHTIDVPMQSDLPSGVYHLLVTDGRTVHAVALTVVR